MSFFRDLFLGKPTQWETLKVELQPDGEPDPPPATPRKLIVMHGRRVGIRRLRELLRELDSP